MGRRCAAQRWQSVGGGGEGASLGHGVEKLEYTVGTMYGTLDLRPMYRSGHWHGFPVTLENNLARECSLEPLCQCLYECMSVFFLFFY